MIAEKIRENGGADLDEDEGDSIDVTQVTNNTLILAPHETIAVLRKARNQMIRTRTRAGVELAKSVDEFLWVIENRAEGEPAYAPPYPRERILAVLEAVLKRGESPMTF